MNSENNRIACCASIFLGCIKSGVLQLSVLENETWRKTLAKIFGLNDYKIKHKMTEKKSNEF